MAGGAIIPRVSNPEVVPTANVQAPGADASAFAGYSLGKGLQAMGVAEQDVGHVMYKLDEERQANGAFTAFTETSKQLRDRMYKGGRDEAGNEVTPVFGRTGSNAIGSGEEIEKYAADLQAKASKDVTEKYGPKAATAFTKLWSQHAESQVTTAQRHEIGQRRAFADATEQGAVSNAASNAVNVYDDPAAVEKEIQTARKAILANTAGDPPDVTKSKLAKVESAVHSQIVQRLLVDDPIKANEYYKSHTKQFTGDDHVRLEKAMELPLERAQARAFVAGYTAVSVPARSVAASIVSAPNGVKVTPEQAQVKLTQYSGDVPAALVATVHGDDAAAKWIAAGRDYSVFKDKGATETYVTKTTARMGERGDGGPPVAAQPTPAASIRMGAVPAPDAKVTRANWNLSFYRPEDLLPPSPDAAVDGRSAQMADALGKQFFEATGIRVGVNDTAPGPGAEGKRRGVASRTDPAGHVENSAHFDGKAFDFQVQNLTPDQRKQFLDMARGIGFTGVGFYSPNEGGHLHLDTGAARSWGVQPAWAGGVAGPQRAYVDPKAFNYQDAMAAAQAQFGDRPDVLLRAQQGLAVYQNQLDRVKREENKQLITDGWAHFAQGGTTENMPPDLMVKMRTQAPEEFIKIEKAEEKRALGGKIKTDWDVYAQLHAMSDADLASPDFNVVRYRGVLADGEFKELVKRQEEARKATTLDGQRSRKEIVDQAIAGSDLSAWDKDKAKAVQVGKLQGRVDDYLASFNKANNKAPTPTELRQEVARLMTPTNAGAWFGSMKYTFELGSAKEVEQARQIGNADVTKQADQFTPASKLEDIPSSDLAFASDQYKKDFGKLPDEPTALRLYNDASRASVGGTVTPSKEDRRQIVSAFVASKNRQPTEDEIGARYRLYVGRYVRKVY